MSKKINKFPVLPHLVWVYPGRLEYALDAVTALKMTQELRSFGWQVTLIASGPSGTQVIGGVEVFCLSNPDIYILRYVLFHLKLLIYLLSKCSSISLILFHQPSAIWILPLYVLLRLQKRTIPLMVMDTRTVPMEDLRKASLRDRLRGELYDKMNYLANCWVDGQTAITQRMAECVKIPPDRLWGIWPSGADLDQFASASEFRHWPGEGEPVHLTYIGVLHYERNLMSLCQAVEMANAEGMHFVLILTGKGTELEALREFASHTEGRIRVDDPVPHEQVPLLLSKVHVGVLPFPDEEKFRVSSPIKLFEYMAAGLPIMATRIACHTDVIKNGQYVFWAEDSSPEGLLAAIRSIWKSRASLKRLGDEAVMAAGAWSWKESAMKLSDALNFGLQSIKKS